MQDLLLYSFAVGEDALHSAHERALKEISFQIYGVSDIAGVEGRASATETTTDDEERKRDALSQRRMERVWRDLM